MGPTVEEALEDLSGSVSAMVRSTVRSAVLAADAACTLWGQSWAASVSQPSERLLRVSQRFVDEIRPRYEDGYEAGMEVADSINWSKLRELVVRPWRIHRPDFGQQAERALETRWGPAWPTRLDDAIVVQGMHHALRDVWAAVTGATYGDDDDGPGEREGDGRLSPEQ